MKRPVAAIIVSLCVAVGSAHARQTPSPAAPVAATPSPKALALTKRYIAALHVDQTMKPMLQGMIGPMLDEQARANPNLTDQQRQAVRETVEEFAAGDLMDEILTRMTPVYATTFSEDELQALVDFYEGPTGQSIVRKMPLMGPAMAKTMVEMMPEIRAKVTTRICQKLDCGAAPSSQGKSKAKAS